ncbi:hypothetical protein ACMZOO_06265 [Catenovulum sp. SX2]|uniref:hypothetical protein n=1 Tax=Catenovulum sp. SX2 TaxID=3398614 RepID=UPI003F87445D
MLTRLIIIITALVISGCASFPGEKLAKVESLPDVSSYKQKPKVVIDLKLFSGKPGTENAIEIAQAQPELQRITSKVIDDAQLFADVSYDSFAQADADYVIKLHLYNHGDQGAAAVMGFLSGFTFGVIPAAATDKYTLQAEVFQNKQSLTTLENNDEMTTWIGIWFIPMMGNTPQKGFEAVFSNMVKDALNKMVAEKQIKYALLPYPLRTVS